MNNSLDNSLKESSFLSKIKTTSLRAIHAFSFTEKIVFYSLLTLFAGSALFMLAKVNEYFTVEVPVSGGSIKEGIVGFPRYINPLLSVTDGGKDLSLLVYSGILKATTDGNLIPDLAESYEISPDGLTYKITLKKNIYFHDNKPITTKDIEFTIKKSIDPILKSPKAPNWQGVAIEVVDDTHINFTLKQPYSPFLENLTLGILPEHIWKNVDSEAFPFSQFNFEPIGSGPYKVDKVKQDNAGLPLYYHFVPFKKHALGKAFINDVYVYFYSNEDKLIKAFEGGEIDHMNSVSPEKVKKLSENKDLNVLRTPLPRTFGLFLNQNEAPVLSNKEVRIALNESINKQEIINNVLFGLGTKSNSPLSSFVLPIDDSSAQPDSDVLLALATEKLEKAGWKKGADGIYEKKDKKGTQKLAFSISTSNVPELKSVAYLLKDTWEKLGASIEVKVFDLADLNQNVIRQRKYDSLLFGQAVGRDLDLYAFWHSSERNDPGLNVSMYTNSKVDKLLNEIRKSSDKKEKIKLLDAFEKEIQNDIPAIFIYSPDFTYITKQEIKGIALQGIIHPSERFLDIQHWYINTDKIWKIFNKTEKTN